MKKYDRIREISCPVAQLIASKESVSSFVDLSFNILKGEDDNLLEGGEKKQDLGLGLCGVDLNADKT